MNKILNTTAIPVSLGWNCHVALFLQDLGDMEKTRYERQVFDWFGCHMWSVCEMLENDFAYLTNRSMIVPRDRLEDKILIILSHTKYDLRFLHEFKNQYNITDTQWTEFETKYARRIQRFKELCASKKPLLFFRLEEDQYNRIQYPEFKKEHNEKYYVERFADIMKEQGVPFQIIFFTTSFQRGYDSERNILYVQFGKANLKVEIGADQMMDILKANLPLIRQFIK